MYKKLLLGLLVLFVSLCLVQGVSAANTAPTLNLPSTLTARADVAYSYQVVAADIDDDTLTFSATTAWATFAMDNSGKISFTPTELDVGSHSVTITVSDGQINTSKSVKFWVNENCDDGALLISDVDIEDKTGDDDQLEPGDYLEIDVEVKNKLTTMAIEDIEIKVWVEDSDGDKITDKVESDAFDVDETDSEKIKGISVQIDLDADSGDYTLVIEAKGEDEDGQIRCNTYRKDIDVEKEDHRLLLDETTIMPLTATCGRTIEVSTHVYNIGEKDEDDVRIRVKNADLGIEQYSEIFEINDGDDEIKMISLSIPATAKAGQYYLDISAVYNSGKDVDSAGLLPITINCGDTAATTAATTTGANNVISMASTSATANIGEKIKFTTTLMNAGDKTTTFTLSLNDVSDWAEGTVEPMTATLASGASIPVYIYITPKSASTHSVTLSVYGDGQLLATKELTIDVVSAAEDAEIEITEWGHGVSTTQTKALIKDYVGTAALVILIVALVILGFALYIVNNRRKPEIILESSKSGRGRRRK